MANRSEKNNGAGNTRIYNRILLGQELPAGTYFGMYTILFLLTAALVYGIFPVNGKSFVYCDTNGGGDGLVQAYNAFVYLGKYLRSIVRHLVYDHRLVIPTWDLTIGYGQDIFTTLNFYSFGEPINLVSVFIPTRYAQLGYTVLILLRMYLSGCTFSLYCRYRGRRDIYALTGALVYVFCHYAQVIGTMHPQFMMPMVLFPLMCLGVERIFREDRHGLFILSCGTAALSNFYQFYMAVLLIILYTFLRYVALYQTLRSVRFIKTVLVFMRDGLIAAGSAAVLMLPSAMAILGAARVGTENTVPVLYEPAYYMNLIASFLSGGGGYYAHLGYCAVGLLGVCALFLVLKDRSKRHMAAAFLIMSLMLCIPFAGHLMNGMGYVVNRWIWGMSFLTAWVTALMLPEIRTFDSGRLKKLLFLVWLYTILVLSFENTREERYMAALVMLLITAGAMYLAVTEKRPRFYSGTALVLTILALAQNSYFTFDPKKDAQLTKFVDNGEAYTQLIEESPAYVVSMLEDHGKYRYDIAGIPEGPAKRNAGMLLNLPGVPYYFSTLNGNISRFNHLMRLNYSMEASYEDLNSRTMLDMLLGVRYMVIPAGQVQVLPYGYKTTVLETEDYEVHRSKLALPLAFATDRIISRETFDALTTVQQQEALVQGVVLEGEQDTFELSLNETSYVPEMEAGDGIEVRDGQIIVRDTSAALTLRLQGRTDGELYVEIEGLSFTGIDPLDLIPEQTRSEMSVFERNMVRRASRYWKEPNSVEINMTCGQEMSKIPFKTPSNPYYSNFHDFICNIGYSYKDGRGDITLRFNTEGIYSYDSLKVTQQPVEELKAWREALVTDPVQDLKTGTNLIRGTVDIDQEEVVFMSVPYSSGWKAYIDGQEAEIREADTAFLGVKVPAGQHSVELRYRSPWLKEGSIITMVSLVLFIVLQFYSGKKRLKGLAA